MGCGGRRQYGCTPLHLAAENGQESCVAMLLKANAPMNTLDKVRPWPGHLSRSPRGGARERGQLSPIHPRKPCMSPVHSTQLLTPIHCP